MAKSTDHLFLEMGSGKFRAGVLSVAGSKLASVYLAEVPGAGLRRGDVHDQGAAAAALEGLLSKLEMAGFRDFRSCDLVLPASLVSSRIQSAKLKLHGLTVSCEHEDELRQELNNCSTDDSSEVIDVSVQLWTCDGYQGPNLPLGRKSLELEALAFCSTMDRQALGRQVALANSVGLEVKATHSGLAGAANLISRLSPDASNRVIIDIGHSFTSGVVVVGQRANAMFTVRAGAHHITRDIAAALNCDLSEAEALKRRLGLSLVTGDYLALPPAADESADAPLSSQTVSPDIYPWAGPRVAEILSLAFRHFGIYAKALDGGITLIGGGSQTLGICSFAGSKLSGVKITRFKPSQDSLSAALGLDISANQDLSLSGFEGLVEAIYCVWQAKYLSRQRGSKAPQFLRPLLSWFTDLSK